MKKNKSTRKKQKKKKLVGTKNGLLVAKSILLRHIGGNGARGPGGERKKDEKKTSI